MASSQDTHVRIPRTYEYSPSHGEKGICRCYQINHLEVEIFLGCPVDLCSYRSLEERGKHNTCMQIEDVDLEAEETGVQIVTRDWKKHMVRFTLAATSRVQSCQHCGFSTERFLHLEL